MDYQHGKIYKILNTVDDSCYIGSTTQPLSKRMASHRKCSNDIANRDRLLYTKMRDLGVANFYIELLEDYPCDNVEQLRRREGHFIREIGTLNQRRDRRTKQRDVAKADPVWINMTEEINNEVIDAVASFAR